MYLTLNQLVISLFERLVWVNFMGTSSLFVWHF